MATGNLYGAQLTPDVVKRLRARYNLTQLEFAEKFGIPLATLRKWEQGQRKPSSAATALLKSASEAIGA
jgi:DNA-binding transcriptional regulator YiaG